MNIHVRGLTPTQIECMERHKRFCAAIKAKAHELEHHGETSEPAQAHPVEVIEPSAVEPELPPVEPKPLWFGIEAEIPIPRNSILIIQKIVCARFNIGVREMIGPRRQLYLIKPRHIAMYICDKVTGKSYPEIGRRFGGRDHSTAIHASQKIAAIMAVDAEFAALVDSLSDEVRSQLWGS